MNNKNNMDDAITTLIDEKFIQKLKVATEQLVNPQCERSDDAQDLWASKWLQKNESLLRTLEDVIESALQKSRHWMKSTMAVCKFLYIFVKSLPSNMHRLVAAILFFIIIKMFQKARPRNSERFIRELGAIIYPDFKFEKKNHESILFYLLRLRPYFEIYDTLDYDVNVLIKDRTEFMRGKEIAKKRHKTMCRVLHSSEQTRRNMLLRYTFKLWHFAMKSVKQQKRNLKSMLDHQRVSPRKFFDKWRFWMIKKKYEQPSHTGHKEMVANIEADVEISKDYESHLEVEIKVMESSLSVMEAKYVQLTKQISDQKVEEIMMFNANLKKVEELGDNLLCTIESKLKEVLSSPCLALLCQMYFADDDEREETLRIYEKMKLYEKNAQNLFLIEAHAETKKIDKQIKQMKREFKLRMHEIRLDLQSESEEKLKKYKIENGAGEDDNMIIEMRDRLENEMETKLKKLESEHMCTLNKDMRTQKAKLREIKQVHMKQVQINRRKNVKAFIEKSRELDHSISKTHMETAIKALKSMKIEDMDKLILLWVQYHLKRLVFRGLPFRRNCLNFGMDLRDGVIYTALLGHLLSADPKSKLTQLFQDTECEDEIDVGRRLKKLMKIFKSMNPPLTAFITSSHILACNQLSNAATLCRLMILKPTLGDMNHIVANHLECELFSEHDKDFGTSAERKSVISQFKQIKKKWYAEKNMFGVFGDREKWKNWCSTFAETDIMRHMENMSQNVERMIKLDDWLEKLRIESYQARSLWECLVTKLRQFQWAILGSKVLQQDSPPRSYDLEKWSVFSEFARFRLIDKRFLKKVQNYTKLEHSRLEKMISKSLQLGRSKEMNLPLNLIVELTESILRNHYVKLDQIFMHYAAADTEGAADIMNLREWASFIRDCRISTNDGKFGHNEISFIFKFIMKNKSADEVADAKARSSTEHDNADDLETQKDSAVIVKEDQDGFTSKEFVEALIFTSLLKDQLGNVPIDKRLQALIKSYILPNAGKTNTDTIRGEMALKSTQEIIDKYHKFLKYIFQHYAHVPSEMGRGLSDLYTGEHVLSKSEWIKMMNQSGVITRKGDVPHDFPMELAESFFNLCQMEEESQGGTTIGCGSEKMIYMEFVEAIAAVACSKNVNPYIPTSEKLNAFIRFLIEKQKSFALRKIKGLRLE